MFCPHTRAWRILEIFFFQKTDNIAHPSGLPQTTQHQQIHYRRHTNNSKYTNLPAISTSVYSNETLRRCRHSALLLTVYQSYKHTTTFGIQIKVGSSPILKIHQSNDGGLPKSKTTVKLSTTQPLCTSPQP